jgi:hypothetical protein
MVLEPAINFSDHLPILCVIGISNSGVSSDFNPISSAEGGFPHLRWDHCDKNDYYNCTFTQLSPISARINTLYDGLEFRDRDFVCDEINTICDSLIGALSSCATICVPLTKKSTLKFWWDEELDALKREAIETHRIWQLAGKPRSGEVFTRRFCARAMYRRRIKEGKRLENHAYTNDLHESLMVKNNNMFWKCFNSKFGKVTQVAMVDGVSDPDLVLDKFYNYFSDMAKPSCSEQAYELACLYDKNRVGYEGDFFDGYQAIDISCVESAVKSFKLGRACGLDGLSPVHLLFSHPIVYSVLFKLFNAILFVGHVPSSFLTSYTVPIPKVSGGGLRSYSCNDFRGIAISSLLSKLFEKCLMDVFGSFLTVSENQFGFKRGVGCSHAINSVKRVVDFYVEGNGTACLSAIDIRKAYDSVDHTGLFIQLMHRQIPICLLRLLEAWLPKCHTCIKWSCKFSEFFRLGVGVRQGSSLAPILFSIYVNDVIANEEVSSLGFLFAFADDILLISLSVCALQSMLSLVECELLRLDLRLNVDKCC